MVLYECDRKACKDCMDTCHLTSYIEHAKNFEKNSLGDYTELESQEKLGIAFRDGLLASGRMI